MNSPPAPTTRKTRLVRAGTSALRDRRLLVPAVAAVCFAVLTFFDRTLWVALRVQDKPRLEKQDWYQVLRQSGHLLPWVLFGAGLFLHDRVAQGHDGQGPHASPSRSTRALCQRGVLLALVPALAGAIAEVLKVTIRRARPLDQGVYRFAWLETGAQFSFGMPSSHAAVAFGGAFAVDVLFPGARWVVFPLAMGTAVSRMLAGSHFATDVLAGAFVGFVAVRVVRTVFPIDPPPQHRTP